MTDTAEVWIYARASAFAPAHMDGLSQARRPEDMAGGNMRVIYARHKRAGR